MTENLYRHSWEGTRRVPFRSILTESRYLGTHGAEVRKITFKLYGEGAVAKDQKRVGSGGIAYYHRRADQLIYSKLDFLNGAFALVPAELDGFESTLALCRRSTSA